MRHQTDPVFSFRFRRRLRLKLFLGPSFQQINVPVLNNDFDFVLYNAQWSENVYHESSTKSIYTDAKEGKTVI